MSNLSKPRLHDRSTKPGAVGDAYVDADARLDVKDVLRQIDWYIEQDTLKGPINGEAIIDKSYVIPLGPS